MSISQPVVGVPGVLGGGAELNLVCPAITPTLGSELLVLNPGFETAGGGGADVFANWSESVAGTSTINDEGTVVHGGTHACRIDIDALNSLAQAIQSIMTANHWYRFSCWAKISATPANVGFGNSAAYNILALTTDYAQYIGSQLVASGNFSLLRSDNCASKSLYFDDASCKELTNLSVYVGTHGTLAGTYACTPTVVDGSQAGIMVAYADANNYVLLLVDMASTASPVVRVHKCLSGTITRSIIAGAITYVAGREAKIVVDASGNVSAYYNNLQIGSTVAVVTTTLGKEVHGFATDASNSVGTVTSAAA
jgi:hypothetical protein